MLAQSVKQSLCPQQAAAAGRAQLVGIDSFVNGRPIHMYNQPRADFGHKPVPKGNQLRVFVTRVDVHQWKGYLAREKRLASEVEHHGRVFADGIQQHRPLELARRLAQDVDCLSSQRTQVR